MNAQGAFTSASTIVSWIADWRIGSIADMNADGIPDLVWQRKVNSIRQVAVWFLDQDGRKTSSKIIGTLANPDWILVGVADYNEDDVIDLLWQHKDTGKTVCWNLNANLVRTNVITLSGSMTDWRLFHWSW